MIRIYLSKLKNITFYLFPLPKVVFGDHCFGSLELFHYPFYLLILFKINLIYLVMKYTARSTKTNFPIKLFLESFKII